MKVVEMRVGDENEIDLRQVLDAAAGMLEPFHEENPVPEIRIDQKIQVGELAEEGGVPDPGDGNLAFDELRVLGNATGARARGEPALPDHFVEEGARIEVVAGGQFLEGAGEASFALGRPGCSI